MDFSRVDRLQSQILKEISDIVANDLRDSPPTMITFTRAEVTRDLKYAKVFYSVLEQENEQKSQEFLQRHTGVIRHLVGRRMRIRTLPEIAFRYDASTENVMRVNEILERLKHDENES